MEIGLEPDETAPSRKINPAAIPLRRAGAPGAGAEEVPQCAYENRDPGEL
jgi:hypothetical protein